MREDYCDITLIVDKSGSMEPLQQETIQGINGFLAAQRKLPGRCVLSLIQFDTIVACPYLGKPIADAPDLTPSTYVPGGSTALLDAVGRGIDELGDRLKAIPETERPGKVIVVIVTDGQENSSQQRTKAQIKEAIARQQSIYKWEFVFLDANMDAFAEAGAINVPFANTLQTHSTGQSVSAAYSSLASNTANYRTGQTQTMAWTAKDRQDQDDAGGGA